MPSNRLPPAADVPPDEPLIVVCVTLGMDHIPSAVLTDCADCRARIWISPSSLALLRVQSHGRAVCLDCAERDLARAQQAGEDISGFIAPGALEELRDDLQGRSAAPNN